MQSVATRVAKAGAKIVTCLYPSATPQTTRQTALARALVCPFAIPAATLFGEPYCTQSPSHLPSRHRTGVLVWFPVGIIPRGESTAKQFFTAIMVSKSGLSRLTCAHLWRDLTLLGYSGLQCVCLCAPISLRHVAPPRTRFISVLKLFIPAIQRALAYVCSVDLSVEPGTYVALVDSGRPFYPLVTSYFTSLSLKLTQSTKPPIRRTSPPFASASSPLSTSNVGNTPGAPPTDSNRLSHCAT